jgi:hypothetical protein
MQRRGAMHATRGLKLIIGSGICRAFCFMQYIREEVLQLTMVSGCAAYV